MKPLATEPVYVQTPAPVVPPPGTRPVIFMGWGPRVVS